jgi:glycosyltransferase involved in cell wall biosynthesis
MRVLLVTGSFPPMRCGVGDYTEQLVRELALRPELEVGVLTSRAAQVAAPGSSFKLLPWVDSWTLPHVGRVLRLVRQWRPDIVHIQLPTQGYDGSWLPRVLPLLCRLSGLRVVQTWHEPELMGRLGFRQLLWSLVQAPVGGGLVVVRPDYDATARGILRVAFSFKTRRLIPNASVIPGVELESDEVESIRAGVAAPGRRVIVYFGFMHAAKGVEQLFQIADPLRDHLVIIGEVKETDAYHCEILRLANTEPWTGRTTLTGFLSPEAAARLLGAADAVVLPFIAGGGEWNTSIHGAQAQKTFVMTTSTQRTGYSPDENTYYARPGDLAQMRAALNQYAGRRSSTAAAAAATNSWKSIGDAHFELYRRVTRKVTG